ncbi:MAG: hypothetical protein E7617_05915 [Ruminococcaceae bacterium]|nr:hypothetical protein [Oscillospiraceae bacterium]
MKKILAFILVLSLAFCFVSCFGGNNNSGDNTGTGSGNNNGGNNNDGGNTSGGNNNGGSNGNLGGSDDNGKEGPIIPWDTEDFEIVN